MDAKTMLAAQGYATARPLTATTQMAEVPAAGLSAEAPSPAGSLAGMAQDFAATLRHGEDTALAAMAGRADPHALVQALAQTELAVETAVTLRNKVVEAYQEILRMPV
ncbi:flagellar hook-basal body complex protein FliE [Frigidibacter oleivorans]|uniref:flagellar hook-basal body complex protein FliE n=1 Tax=Frigidibacter oleivorans TaxID=2487129 RepID=UPI000F8DF8B9|nr:flagellar hook-basal body complex protein FliE [Frigidibacter oleivorans]